MPARFDIKIIQHWLKISELVYRPKKWCCFQSTFDFSSYLFKKCPRSRSVVPYWLRLRNRYLFHAILLISITSIRTWEHFALYLYPNLNLCISLGCKSRNRLQLKFKQDSFLYGFNDIFIFQIAACKDCERVRPRKCQINSPLGQVNGQIAGNKCVKLNYNVKHCEYIHVVILFLCIIELQYYQILIIFY